MFRFLGAVVAAVCSAPFVIGWFLLFLVMSNWATNNNWIWWWLAPLVLVGVLMAVEARVHKRRHRRRP
jgi:hypothetical protein